MSKQPTLDLSEWHNRMEDILTNGGSKLINVLRRDRDEQTDRIVAAIEKLTAAVGDISPLDWNSLTVGLYRTAEKVAKKAMADYSEHHCPKCQSWLQTYLDRPSECLDCGWRQASIGDVPIGPRSGGYVPGPAEGIPARIDPSKEQLLTPTEGTGKFKSLLENLNSEAETSSPDVSSTSDNGPSIPESAWDGTPADGERWVNTNRKPWTGLLVRFDDGSYLWRDWESGDEQSTDYTRTWGGGSDDWQASLGWTRVASPGSPVDSPETAVEPQTGTGAGDGNGGGRRADSGPHAIAPCPRCGGRGWEPGSAEQTSADWCHRCEGEMTVCLCTLEITLTRGPDQTIYVKRDGQTITRMQPGQNEAVVAE